MNSATHARAGVAALRIDGRRDRQREQENQAIGLDAVPSYNSRMTLLVTTWLAFVNFIAGAGKSLPADYQIPGHVHKPVVDDIATWILETARVR